MLTKLSSKGQVVLPKQARMRLHLVPGVKLECRVQDDAIILIPEARVTESPKLIRDSKSGLQITKSPAPKQVTNDDVRAAMLDFS